MNTIIPKGKKAAEVLKNIRLNRLDRRYLQKELAEEIGANRVSIINIENGRQGLTRNLLDSIMKRFKKDVKELLPEEFWNFFEDEVNVIEKPSAPVYNLATDSNLIESLKLKIIELENDKKMLIEEKGKLMNIIDKLSGAVAG